MTWNQVINTPDFSWSVATKNVLSAINPDYPLDSSLLLHNAIFKIDAVAYSEFLEYVESQLLPVRSIAEYGCGNGSVLYYFANVHHASVTGCDISLELINNCKAVMPTAIFDIGTKFSVIDKTVDYCLSNSVFQYFESDEYAADVIREMQRVSSKGIFITDIKSADYKLEFKHRQAVRQNLTMSQLDAKYSTTPLRFYRKDFFEQFGDVVFLPMPSLYPDSSLHSFSVLIR